MMPMIDITPEEDARLEKIVPMFLRGDKCLTKRVKWAIDEICKRASSVAPTPQPQQSYTIPPAVSN